MTIRLRNAHAEIDRRGMALERDPTTMARILVGAIEEAANAIVTELRSKPDVTP